MKKTFLLLTIAALFASCGSENSKKEGVQQIDSAYYHKAEGPVECTVRASLPVERLNQAVGEWLDEALGGLYPGDPTDIQAIADYYGKAMTDTLTNWANDPDLPDFATRELAFEARMEYAYETNEFVTYTLTTYTDLGGAHPTSTSQGATFRKKDGRRVDWNMIASHYGYKFQELLKDSLMEYFGADTDEELSENLLDTNIYNIPYPKTPPYFLEDGIAVIYQQYEIAPYAFGMPNFLLAYEESKPLMTGWAKRMLK